MAVLRVKAVGPLTTTEATFGGQAPVSDHLPQAYTVTLPASLEPTTRARAAHDAELQGGGTLHLLVWNVMCRGRAGREGKEGSVLEGRVLTNNGLGLDETADSYERRILQRVAPVISDWMKVGSSQSPSLLVACLQELPAQPLLQEDLLAQLRTSTGRPGLVIVLMPSKCENRASNPSTCTGVLWDSQDMPTVRLLQGGGEDVVGALGVMFTLACGLPIALFSIHLPFVDNNSSTGREEATRRLRGGLATLRARSTRAGASVAVIAGDFNVDVPSALSSLKDAGLGPLSFDTCADSATFRGALLTVDACVALSVTDAEAAPAISAEPLCSSEFAGQGLWRVGGSAPFFGKSREVFLESSVSKGLHDDPRLWGLSDNALATLGLWPFADQARALTLVHARGRDPGTSQRKRRRLANPLAESDVSSSGSDSSSGSEEEGDDAG